MSRPRSIPGLLARLASIHVRRRPRTAVAVVAVAAGLVGAARIGGGAAGRPPVVQAAVLADGFAVTTVGAGGRAVLELDRDGTARRTRAVRREVDAVLVGTRGGPALVWLEQARIHVAQVGADGGLDEPSLWGKAPVQLCDGVATDDGRFGVGWLERDGSVWMVHGPVAAGAGEAAAVEVTAVEVVAADADAADAGAADVDAAHVDAQRTRWCGIASAGANIALLSRSGGKLTINRCTAKQCQPGATSVAVPPKDEVLAVGCTGQACAIATRGAGGAQLRWVTSTGRVAWTRPLAITATSTVAMTRAGATAIALGGVTAAGAVVVGVTDAGIGATVWTDPDDQVTPALAWSRGSLLIARAGGADLVRTDVVALPRD
jgi:hypothetical protein